MAFSSEMDSTSLEENASKQSLNAKRTRPAGGQAMLNFQDLFQWDRFITPTIVKTFYVLVVALIILFGISGILSGLAMMAVSPFGGFLVVLYSIASVLVGIIFSRIATELILIVFRINEHLGAIRDQGGMH
jgi:predicted membrane metal-binding protein